MRSDRSGEERPGFAFVAMSVLLGLALVAGALVALGTSLAATVLR